MARNFALVGVIGLGTMGAGIVEVFARNGIEVVAVESSQAGVDKGRGVLRHSTDRAVSRGKLSEADQEALHARVRFTAELADLAECDLVIEAVPERLDLKRSIFARLDEIVKPDAVLATNTSSLSVTEISVATHNPRRVVGMHFFNPAPVLKFVEVIRTVVTEEAVVDDVKALAERLGKMPVVIGDKAGFIANALLFGYLNHAVSMFESRYATREDIDSAMQLGCGLPMGPLALMDATGCMRRARCSSRWSPPASRAARPARASTRTTRPGPPASSPTRSPPPVTPPPAASARCAASAWSGPAPWPPASSRCSRGPGTT